MEQIRIFVIESPNREEIIDDLLETISDNTDVGYVDFDFHSGILQVHLGMIANAEVFAVLLTLKYQGADVRL